MDTLNHILNCLSLACREGLQIKEMTISDYDFSYLAFECKSNTMDTISIAGPDGIVKIKAENKGNTLTK